MVGIKGVEPTTEEKIALIPEVVQKTDTTQAELVEQAGNVSAGSPGFLRELSKKQNSFEDRNIDLPSTSVNDDPSRSSLNIPTETLIDTGAIGFDSSEVKDQVQDPKSSAYWLNMKKEGVPA